MTKLIIGLSILLSLSSCKKSSDRCTNVTVTLTAPSCSQIGVILNGIKYPSDDLPAQYAIEGNNICIEYSFWDDPKECPCCGGTKVHIISVY